jgi:hypothetical protein
MDGGPAVMIKSLRGRLLIGLTAIIVLTGAIGGTLAYKWTYNEAIAPQVSQVGNAALVEREAVTLPLDYARACRCTRGCNRGAAPAPTR